MLGFIILGCSRQSRYRETAHKSRGQVNKRSLLESWVICYLKGNSMTPLSHTSVERIWPMPAEQPKSKTLAILYRFILGVAALLLLTSQTSLDAQTLPSGFDETRIAYPLANPTAMTFAPDGRLFVCEQAGRLRVIKNDILLDTPFLTLDVDSTGERGLIGVAVDPNFTLNNYVYIYYTAKTPTLHNRVSRFTANGDVVVPGSEFILLDIDDIDPTLSPYHNGGSLHFGPDGNLYIGTGDHSWSQNAQDLSLLKGKLLRINP